SLALLTIATAIVTHRLGSIVSVSLAGLLILLNFQALIALVDRAFDRTPAVPGYGYVLAMVGRLVLMALLLYGILLLPGIHPIPVALGLSVLVLAILVEALIRVFFG
ncbi:MAG: ATP synthase subunit I, partial [Acidobacteriota bacterium]